MPLQKIKDKMSRDLYGMTAREAWETGNCINCKEPALEKCYSSAGQAEFGITGMCEECFDGLFN